MVAVDVLTHVKFHKGVVSLAFLGGANSDGTESALSFCCVIAFL